MEKSLKYFHERWLLLTILLLSACHPPVELYQRNFSEEERKQLGEQFLAGVGEYYYQGTPQETFLIKEGILHQPNAADLWREFGAPNIKRGFASASFEYYGKSVELAPIEWQGWRGYLYLYFYRDYQRALDDFNATDTLTPDFIDYPQATSVDFMRAICYLKLGKHEEMFRFLERHIAEEQRTVGEEYIDTRVFLYQGIAHMDQGRIEESMVSFKRGLKNANEKNADLWYYLAKAESMSGLHQEALASIEQAEQQFKNGYFHDRNYVEEFYQIYPSMIEKTKNELIEKM